ncbi:MULTISPECIES: DUF6069 family protein [Gordonia]|jgi:hypothetical protein|uniref:Uncharacterized protein n=1 Tax=Gordonia malaquae NBRC 108250 TaxID=1223542 RepID=M3ULP8_GORML|nr:DUF6069 family protein [Gordonia malaquae]GAC80650.1 hypothetical protein GM1_020_00140 [Gordonia malaquae NBRC 108250]SEC24789.1 hypothetical protein SAMN04488550_1532 [Gordonia malaquae]
MTNYDPRDPRNRGDQNPQTRAYSQANDYGDYAQPKYTEQYYSEPQYAEPQYAQPQYAEQPQQRRRPAQRRGPDVDPVMFCGGVLMTGVVTGLAAWLAGWIIRTITQKVNDSGQFGVWNPLSQDELWFALVGFVVALLGGALWYLLQVGTPAPDQFYRWIVGLLIACAVVIPLTMSAEISTGIGTAVMHLIIGLPVLALIPTMANASRRKNQR